MGTAGDREAGRDAPLVDLAETLALLVVPALLLAVGLSVLGRTEAFVPGLAIGGLFGAILARHRRGFRAVRTPTGVERRPRTVNADAEGGVLTRLVGIEYDPRYDWVLAVSLALVGLVAFAAIPLFDPEGRLAIRLVVVGLLGLVGALLALGASRR